MDFVTFLAGLLLIVLVIVVLAIGTERGTELVKLLRNGLHDLPPRIFDNVPTGPVSSWLLALATAAVTVLGLSDSLLPLLPGLSHADPIMVKLLGTVLVWAASSVVHEKIPSPQLK